MNKKNITILVVGMAIVVIALVGGLLVGKRPSSTVGQNIKAVVYKSPTCGCCNNYVSYLKKNGFEVETVNTNNMDEMKTKYSIPATMESCHTTVIGDYVVEGHVPVEAIAKLLNERPNLTGIAMPGMPAGSPGMTGSKQGAFQIYGFSQDGSTETFTQL